MVDSKEINLNIFHFDINQISYTKGCNIVIIGENSINKSFLAKDLLYKKRDANSSGFVITKSKLYHNFFPDMFKYDQYSPLIIKRILEKKENVNPFILIDDKLFKKDEYLNKLYDENKSGVLSIFVINDTYQKDIVNKANCIFILKNISNEYKGLIYEKYSYAFKTKKLFEKALEYCTEDNDALVIYNETETQCKLFIYKYDKNIYFNACSDIKWYFESFIENFY